LAESKFTTLCDKNKTIYLSGCLERRWLNKDKNSLDSG